MALQTKVVKQKIKSVGNIKKITKAMEMISVSKMRKSVKRTLASRIYARYALEVLVNLHKYRNIEHPLIVERASGTALLVLFASNKGLCGGYNVNVQKAIQSYLVENDAVDCITVGKQADKIAKRLKLNIVASFNELPEYFGEAEINRIVNMFIELFTSGAQYRKVAVAYTRFVNSQVYEPRVREIIPLDPKLIRRVIEEEEEGRSDKRFEKNSMALYLFEPTEEEVLNTVVPSLIRNLFFQIALEASASEHSARMTAMRSASDNASQMLSTLQVEYNRARQAGITKEISEIVAGAEALH